MILYRLDEYELDFGNLIGFFTSEEAALEYALCTEPCRNPNLRHHTEITSFRTNRTLSDDMDGRVDDKKGRAAWENGKILDIKYYR